MIYQPHQIGLWLRVLNATRSIDPVMASAFEQLMTQGAAVEIRQDGGLQFGPGTMPQADYDKVKTDVLFPRRQKLPAIQQKVRSAPHPWATAVQAAYRDLAERAAKGMTTLYTIAEKGNTDQWKKTAPIVADRLWQAFSLSRALIDAGYAWALKAGSDHLETVMDLEETMRKGDLPVDHGGRSWPVETPDGWIWVIDVPGAALRAVNLGGKVGTKEPLAGEPVVTDWDLGMALAPIDVGQAMREVC